MPLIKLLGSHPRDLQDVDMTILIMDHDSAKADDPMGQCVVTLSGLKDEQFNGREPVVIDHDLTLWGKPAGHLCGKIFVHLPRATRESGNFQHFVDTKAGCCTIG